MNRIRKAALVCCSDGEPRSAEPKHRALISLLEDHGIAVERSPFLYAERGHSAGTARERANAVNRFFREPGMDAVLDLSGGDMANEILEYLDYDAAAESDTRFWGYSDLTTVVNALYAMAGKTSVLYQAKNLVGSCSSEQKENFFSDGELFRLPIRFLQGNRMEGTVVGGNIRCLLKLAGTKYFPPVDDRILLLEANSGRVPQMTAYLSQLSQLGVLRRVRGILLGTFTQMEREGCRPTMEELVLSRIGGECPVAGTDFVGHGADSRAVLIGGSYLFDGDTGRPVG